MPYGGSSSRIRWRHRDSVMGRVCTICSHAQRYEIEELLATRQSTYRAIARTYGVSEDAVGRHVSSRHVSQLISLAADAERVARADTLLDRLEAFREMRSNLELIGEVTRELDRAGTINLELSVEWQEVKAVLVNTLASYPEAQQAVFNALEEAPNGN